jgi:CBS domain-containing protein
MRTGLITVTEETRIEDAIRLMTQHGIKRLPVVDESGVFRGMVSRDSLLRAGLEQEQ